MPAGFKNSAAKYGTIIPYGLRHSGVEAKGKGYFGELPSRQGMMTEYSRDSEDGKYDYPLVVPTLDKRELDSLMKLRDDEEVLDSIEKKAKDWAEKRRSEGKSPFATGSDLRRPTPKKKGGVVKSASSRADGIAKRGKTRGRMV